jgi:phospholipid-binding lipoprotein MlaA
MVAVTVAVVMAGSYLAPGAAAEQADVSLDVLQAGSLSRGGDTPAELFPLLIAVNDRSSGRSVRLARSAQGAPSDEPVEMTLRQEKEAIEEYDPWEPYNEVMFDFNHKVFDRYLLKPVATAWDTVVPDPFQRSFKNAFENLAMPRRLVNSLLQLKFKVAGYEVIRFLLNTTIGVAGLFDIATEGGIPKSDEDTGQTLGVYGVGPGPYLILPILPPLTVRDGFGFAVDVALDPLNYVVPFAATAGKTAGKTVNDRSLNLEFFESVEENTVDLYSAVRNAYLQRRQNAIEQ